MDKSVFLDSEAKKEVLSLIRTGSKGEAIVEELTLFPILSDKLEVRAWNIISRVRQSSSSGQKKTHPSPSRTASLLPLLPQSSCPSQKNISLVSKPDETFTVPQEYPCPPSGTIRMPKVKPVSSRQSSSSPPNQKLPSLPPLRPKATSLGVKKALDSTETKKGRFPRKEGERRKGKATSPPGDGSKYKWTQFKIHSRPSSKDPLSLPSSHSCMGEKSLFSLDF